MPTNNAKPRAKAAKSNRARRAASTSSRANPSSIRPSTARANAAGPIPEAACPNPQENPTEPAKKKRRLKPMSIGRALRAHGLDEHTIADTYVHVVAKLTNGTTRAGAVEKLLVDVLKECSKRIDDELAAQRASAEAAAADAPVYVQLLHAVPRPDRTAAQPENLGLESATSERA